MVQQHQRTIFSPSKSNAEFPRGPGKKIMYSHTTIPVFEVAAFIIIQGSWRDGWRHRLLLLLQGTVLIPGVYVQLLAHGSQRTICRRSPSIMWVLEVTHEQAGEAPWQPCLLNFLLGKSTGTLSGTSQGIPTKPKTHSDLSSCMYNGRSRTHPTPSHAALPSRLVLRALFPSVHSLPLSASASKVLCFTRMRSICCPGPTQVYYSPQSRHILYCLSSGMSTGHGQRPAWRSLLSSLCVLPHRQVSKPPRASLPSTLL